MRFWRRVPRMAVLGLLLLTLGMISVGAGPADEATDWVIGSGYTASADGGPVCYGSSRDAGVHDYYPLIYGRSTMDCSPPATLQTMVAQLIKCDTWFVFICLNTSIEQHLDDGSELGPGAWQLPTDNVYYVSDLLENGRYRVKTTHGVFWPGGQDVGESASAWIEIDY